MDGECWPCRGHRRKSRSGGRGRGSTWFDWSRGGRGPEHRGAGCSPGLEGTGEPRSRRRGRENPTQSLGARGAARGGPGRRRQRPSTSRGRARRSRRGSDTKKRPGDTISPDTILPDVQRNPGDKLEPACALTGPGRRAEREETVSRWLPGARGHRGSGAAARAESRGDFGRSTEPRV